MLYIVSLYIYIKLTGIKLSEEPADIEEIPIFTKRSKKLNSKGKAWMLKYGYQTIQV